MSAEFVQDLETPEKTIIVKQQKWTTVVFYHNWATFRALIGR